jgi:hypothetical protein
MAAAVALSGASPEVKLPVPLFRTHLATGPNVLGYKPQYAVSRDGLFLLNTAIESRRSRRRNLGAAHRVNTGDGELRAEPSLPNAVTVPKYLPGARPWIKV